MYRWFYVQKQQNTKENKFAGASGSESPTLVRHTSLIIYSIPLTTQTENGSKDLQGQLGCA